MLVDRRQARHGLFGQRNLFGEHEVGIRLQRAAAHAALQLVHLRQTQTVRVLDDQRVGVRVVDAAFDDGGGHHHVQLARGEFLHHAFQLLLAHLAVRDAHARFRSRLLHALGGVLDALHPVGHVVHLAMAVQLAADGTAHHVGVPLAHLHLHGPSLVGRGHDQAHFAHAGKRHLHGARDGRSRKREHIDTLAQVLHLLLMPHAEALFLVDDDQAQIVRVHIAREQPVRTHQHLHAAVGKTRQRRLGLSRGAEAAEHFHLHPEGRETVVEGGEMLLRQNGGGAQHHHLLVVLRCLERRAQCHFGLAEAHVAADQSVHGTRGLHVGLDVGNCRQLVGRFLVREGFLHLALPGGIGRIAVALRRRTAGVHVHQVECQLLAGLARLVQRTAPVAGVQPGQAWASAFRTHIAGHPVQLLYWHVQLVVFRVFQQQVVAHHTAHFLADDVLEQRDAVGGMHHIVARLEGEGDLGHVHALAGAQRGRSARVVDAHQGQLRLRDDQAQRHVHVHDVHHAAAQAVGSGIVHV